MTQTHPKTLLELAGVTLGPPPAEGSALILIDAQREYVDGLLALPGVKPALDALAVALERARSAGVPVVHVVHRGKPGGPFDPQREGAAIAAEATPAAGEAVVEKTLPNAFTGTQLQALLDERRVVAPVFAGFMTHLCVSSSTRAALELGYQPRVVHDACATRALSDVSGVVPADLVHRASLAALADRFAGVVAAARLWS